MKNELVLNQPGVMELGEEGLKEVEGGMITGGIHLAIEFWDSVGEFCRGFVDGYKENNY